MSTCQTCKSSRLLFVQSHASDMHFVSIGEIQKDGYLPYDIGLDGGDDLCMTYCLDCGQIQGTFPLPLTELEAGTDDEDSDD